MRVSERVKLEAKEAKRERGRERKNKCLLLQRRASESEKREIEFFVT